MRRLLGCLCIGLLSLGCAFPKANVVLLGDSITYGVVSGEPGPSFAELLQRALGDRVEFHNISCGGVTVALWQSDEAPAFCQHEWIVPSLFGGRALPLIPTDLVVILLGTNDSMVGGGIGANVYGQQMESLSAALLGHGAERVMILAPPSFEARPEASALLEGYRREVMSLCARREEIVCGPDLFELLEASDFADQDVHPNADGHARIARAMEPLLRETLNLR